eukprot:TRINITY_DN55583_c0_g1_i1.p1 TRINITY_DN55583_c0_g1~~TRINITY_DN55583_c0_g1_i1.p1  ORF type:complete len:453 (-),score=105.92 TRINITY_DN55583_c0_g1_i1:84-1442(-)
MADQYCPVCLDVLTDPYILKCGHNICSKCLTTSRQYTNSCPLRCKASLDEAVENKSLNQAIAKVRDSICENCEEARAEMECGQCQLLFCLACNQEIHRKGAMSRHVTQPISVARILRTSYCKEHNEKLSLYCATDRQLVCSVCLLVGNHKNHPCAAFSDEADKVKDHVQRKLSSLEDQKELAVCKRALLETFKKDVQESFTDCRMTVKKLVTTMINYLKAQQEEYLKELDQTVKYNLDTLQHEASKVDRSLLHLEAQIDAGRTLLREPDPFTFFAKGSIFMQYGSVPNPVVKPEFRDTFPDLTQLSLLPYCVPLQHAVAVNIREFLTSGVGTRICGNIFHNGFRFQIQLKHDDRHLSAYLCLRAWHDVSTFMRVTVNFTLTLQDGPELLHSATAKNTFEGPNDGWGWNKFISTQKLADCTDVLFLVQFNEMNYGFLQEDTGVKQEVDEAQHM